MLLRFSKSCKRTVSDGFVKKSADSDSVSDSRRRQPQADAPDNSAEAVIILVRTSPRPSTLHCPICAQTAAAASAASDNYLKLRTDVCLDRREGAAAARPFNLPHARTGGYTQLRNVVWMAKRHLISKYWLAYRRPKTVTYSRKKIRGFGLGRTRKESADSVADSESVTTLVLYSKNLSNYLCFSIHKIIPFQYW